MCGRFVSTNSAEDIAEFFAATVDTEPLPLNYNVAPTDDVYAVVHSKRRDEDVVRSFRWGLVPSWAKDARSAATLINARSETITEKPSFSSVFKSRRCIVPMDGFYEWKAPSDDDPPGPKGKPVKQPRYIHRADGAPLAVAGLWSAWRDRAAGPDAPWLLSCSVITTSANELMSTIHDRMPVLLDPEDWSRWLDPAVTDVDWLLERLRPADEDALTMHRVSTDVNSVRNEGAHLIEPVDGGEPQPRGGEDQATLF